jgi:hypothetical protein
MKTILISGSSPMPPALRDLIARGSTSLQERRASETSASEGLDADRVVFWAARGDDDLRELAKKLARAEARERREVIVFVTPDDGGVEGLAAGETFVWPRDDDRLKMAFMTGA